MPNIEMHHKADNLQHSVYNKSTTKSSRSEEQASDDSSNADLVKKIVAFYLFPGFIIFFIIDSANGDSNLIFAIDRLSDWTEANTSESVSAFIGVYFAATVLFIPAYPLRVLTLGFGFIFSMAFGLLNGMIIASIAVFVGASSGALASFLLGRYLLRDWVMLTVASKYQLFGAIDTALTNNGLKIMSLLRLSPIIPFNALNYIAGVTSVSFLDNALSLIYILPRTVLCAFIGSCVGSLVRSESITRITTAIITITGIVSGLLVIAVTSFYAKKELNTVIVLRDAEGVEDDASLQSSRTRTTDCSSIRNDGNAETVAHV